MIDIANGYANRTDTSDLWRNRCVNHQYFLRCTQGTSEGLGCGKLQTGSIVGTLPPRAVFAHSEAGETAWDRRARPPLPAFFSQPYAVYMRPDGFSHSHTVFCTPHRHREGGR